MRMAPSLLTTHCREVLRGMRDDPEEVEREKKELLETLPTTEVPIRTRLDLLPLMMSLTRVGQIPDN